MPKRKLPDRSPWHRNEIKASYTLQEWEDIKYYLKDCLKYSREKPMFGIYDENKILDLYARRVALSVTPFTVALVAYKGEEMLYQTSGTVIESDDVSSVIFTSANLIRCPITKAVSLDNIKVFVCLKDERTFIGEVLTFDTHYNIAAIKIQPNVPLSTASLKFLDDSISIDRSVPHREKTYNLIPGDRLFAIGRYFVKPYDIMVAPGEFCLDRCDSECKELFMTSCRITRCGIGGPICNCNGEVIGICVYDCPCTPFLPINLISKWWNQYKTIGITRQPYLGLELTNLYAAELDVMEEIIYKFPNISKGVFVEEVVPGSVADFCGLRANDVIAEFGGKAVDGFLELIELMWDKVGDSVDLVVLRSSDGAVLKFCMPVGEATPDQFYSWPLWENQP